ncbi:MAG: GTPase HflX [Pseudomonadota bacterium]|nr:GTPase HflX [Pseudomonadota bacterium]
MKITRSSICVCSDFNKKPKIPDIVEFESLNLSYATRVAFTCLFNIKKVNSKHYFTISQIALIKQAAEETCATMVTLNTSVQASQVKQLTKLIGLPVLDRTDLLLALFEDRARSSTGKLQVELAKYKHQLTQLVRGWTHLERQKGGIAHRGGPGEKQIELDRRILRDKIHTVQKRLKVAQKTRLLNLVSRQKSGVFNAAMIGYTNAGKSTLFNLLTQSNTFQENLLFATLDPLSRRLQNAYFKHIILTDTVGFIQNMPNELQETFYDTLVEVKYTDLILHVVDYTEKDYMKKIYVVQDALKKIDAADKPTWIVYNKVDSCLNKLHVAEFHTRSFYVSAKTGHHIEQLRQALINYA